MKYYKCKQWEDKTVDNQGCAECWDNNKAGTRCNNDTRMQCQLKNTVKKDV